MPFYFPKKLLFFSLLINTLPSQKNAKAMYINTANVRIVCDGWKYCSRSLCSAKKNPTPSNTMNKKYIRMPDILFCFTFPIPATRMNTNFFSIEFFFKRFTQRNNFSVVRLPSLLIEYPLIELECNYKFPSAH